ncbi:MAG TPA: class I SAM-dependent methyltransferase [Micromonosporaceae bacterium]|jgi:2-polyprenyl-3-methyl-5-hydroxy-6-metoxy-1,4-benzoquinol methylase
MTTTEQEQLAAVDEQMGRLVTDLGSGLQILLISLGTRSGLWSAMAGAGPLSVADVAAKVAVDPALVRDWLCAQAASGYLTYDGGSQTFTLPDAGAAVLVHGPGGPLVEGCVSMFTSMLEGFTEFSEAFASGKGFGWHQRTAAHWHGNDSFTRVALPTELIAAAIDQARGVPEALRAGGSVADVGCGYGTPTLGIAGLYPTARVLGVDYHDASIMAARDVAAREGMPNVRFEVAAAADLPGDGYHLITFFDSLHDLGDPRGALIRARAALAPEGAVLLIEPASFDRVEENLNPGGRMFYAVSTLACTPNAVSQRTATSSEPLGAQAGEAALRAVAAQAGFGSVRRLEVPAPMNLVLELRP